ncbi:hypothetical protein LTS09_001887, partial [Friedmanniomyces endolithicus]
MPSRRLGFRSWRGRERDDGLENWGCAVIIRDEMCRGVAVSLLPQELQGRIYAAALTHDGALHFGFDLVDYNCYSTLVNTNAAALAPLLHGLPRACKALRSQSRPLVLRENVFAFALWREKEQSGNYSFHFAMQAVEGVFRRDGSAGVRGNPDRACRFRDVESGLGGGGGYAGCCRFRAGAFAAVG